MDVPVHFKPGHRWLRSRKTPSVLGGGLLERARSTTLALLGVTTAVGLAMVALALNQSWPLVAGSPIPGVRSGQEAIGKATVAAQVTANAPDSGPTGAGGSPRSDRSRVAGGDDGDGAQAPDVGSAPSASAELVVAPSAPAEPQGDAPSGAPEPNPAPSPTGKTPQALAPPPEPAQPEPAPQSPPVVESTPPPTSAEVPVDSSDDDDWDDDGDDWDDDDGWDDNDDWGGDRQHGHDRGHHWSRGRHDD